MKKNLGCLIVFFVLVIGIFPVWGNGNQQQDKRIKVVFIAMDSMDMHWLTVKSAIEAKAAEIGNINFIFNAPPGKVDPSIQLQMVEDAITQKADILMLAPLHADALVPGIEKAHRAGIKVIMIDTKANTEEYDCFLGTDNAAAARIDANEMGKVLNGRGKIAIINAQAGAFTTLTRENAFKEEIAAKYPAITIVGTQYSDGDRTKALNIATDFITAYPDLAGIYACNDGATVGGANGLEQASKAGIIKFIGWDWSDHKPLIERGVIQVTLVQNPWEMGYQGLQMGIDVLNGKTVPRYVDTGVRVITKENVDTVQ
jgi:ribose transport system substrate-binding protein